MVERVRTLIDQPVSDEALRVLAISDFVFRYGNAHPDWLRRFDGNGAARPVTAQDVERALEPARNAPDPPTLKAALRQARNELMARFSWRHLTGRAPLEETIENLSALADGAIEVALTKLHDWLVERFGVPLDDDGRRQRLVVLAMGKLGARELNLSSDIDLIFTYPSQGPTENGSTSQQFFLRLGQQLIDALDSVTEDGFVFRVDMRLRPYGASGPLVLPFDGLQGYYEAQGRDWERYALIKARACAGDRAAGEDLLSRLEPFVFRRYLDFGAVQAMRDMQTAMRKERSGEQYQSDIKLGPGGIRDVEFVVQLQQLIWGGRLAPLRQRALMPVVRALVDAGIFTAAQAEALLRAYRFLRDTEHSLQSLADQQTQQLPAGQEERLRVAVSRGFDDWPAFETALNEHRTYVAALFGAFTADDTDSEATPLWPVCSDDDQVLQELGFSDPARARQELEQFQEAAAKLSGESAALARLNRLMPCLLGELCRIPSSGQNAQPYAPGTTGGASTECLPCATCRECSGPRAFSQGCP